MKLEDIVLNGVSQAEKDKCHMISLHVESKEQNKQTKNKQTHRYREHFDGCQMGEVWMFG